MITNLHIKNIGIIDDLNIELENGFNVFTGETGAGKTLIIDAISIICGARFSKEMIRKGESYSFIELNLYLPNNEKSIEGNIIISREVYANGRNLCKINGRLVTVTELKEFMINIIDIHGQNDNQKILNTKYHIKYLDNFCGQKLLKNVEIYKKYYNEYCDVKRQLKENLGDNKEKQRKLDLLQYELDEIDKANLKVNEEETLREKSIIFENSEKISKSLNDAKIYSDEAIDNINKTIKSIDKIANIDEKYNSKLSELKNIYYEIEEFSRDLTDLNLETEFDEEERDKTEERLDLIASLKRKYGNSIEEILQFRNEIESEIVKINNIDEYNNELRKKISVLEEKMKELANKIHEIREKTSQELNEKINSELKELEMPNSKFYSKVELTENFNSRGMDNVQFFISTNVGEDIKELDKIASGGEMARIMLAIKTVFANTDNTPIMIFDEIDTGISGRAAKSVGKKMKIIGQNHQVICITHQPSIAAKGDSNFFISKETTDGRTHTNIKKLNENEIIDEIARISNGDITEIARKHASELRKSA